MSVRVLIVEDDPVIAADLEFLVANDDYQVAGVAYDSTRALDLLHRFRPDIVLLDIAIRGDKDGIALAAIIRDKYRIPFIYITAFADKETLERAKSTLPDGYIVKPFKERDVISAIEMAVYRHAVSFNKELPDAGSLTGRFNLTPGEIQVLSGIWAGQTNQQISDALGISLNTVKTHLKNIFIKLDVRSRTEALVLLRNS
jgi:DNA-binding NarL/FixJ family response regulator